MARTGLFSALLFVLLWVLPPQSAKADFFKSLVDNVGNSIERQAERRINRKTDEAVDKAFDKAEEGAEQAVTGERGENQTEQQATPAATSTTEQTATSEPEAAKAQEIKWARFDFVPGDQVIFEDTPGPDEENGEFPSRWDLHTGNVEIAAVDGEQVIMFPSDGLMVPYLKNSRDDYLPDVFTLEFDAFFTGNMYPGRYFLYFYDRKNQSSGKNSGYMTVYVNQISMSKSEMIYPGRKKGNWDATGGWRHISIAFTKGKLKAYMDDTRLINIPHYEGNPSGITIGAERNQNSSKFIKNIRLAKGGVKYYDRILSDGKIIVNGIRFDVNQANIRPESNGAINEIVELMKKHPELSFSVEGHTDSDGSDARNLELSQARAEAVAKRLVELGIAADRLQAKGWGESKPLDTNDSAEGRANNRRVEFVKL